MGFSLSCAVRTHFPWGNMEYLSPYGRNWQQVNSETSRRVQQEDTSQNATDRLAIESNKHCTLECTLIMHTLHVNADKLPPSQPTTTKKILSEKRQAHANQNIIERIVSFMLIGFEQIEQIKRIDVKPICRTLFAAGAVCFREKKIDVDQVGCVCLAQEKSFVCVICIQNKWSYVRECIDVGLFVEVDDFRNSLQCDGSRSTP